MLQAGFVPGLERCSEFVGEKELMHLICILHTPFTSRHLVKFSLACGADIAIRTPHQFYFDHVSLRNFNKTEFPLKSPMQLNYFVFLPAVSGHFDPPCVTEALFISYIIAFQFKLMEKGTPALQTLPFALTLFRCQNKPRHSFAV